MPDVARAEIHRSTRSLALLDVVGRADGWLVGFACFVATAVVGIVDGATGDDVSLSAFYLLPVLVAASRGRAFGARVAVVSTVVWFVSDLMSRVEPYSTVAVPVWNAAVRSIVFMLIVLLVGALRRSVAQAQALARCDALSGLPNFRAFHEVAGAELRRLSRSSHPLVVAYVDIDNFKMVNDEFGHSVGDDVIVSTGAILERSLRDVDTVARVGGDEFALLLVDTEADDAVAVLERLHGSLVAHAAEQAWPIGYSIGAVVHRSPPASVAAMVSGADQVMYEVKHEGKNAVRVVSVSPVGAIAAA